MSSETGRKGVAALLVLAMFAAAVATIMPGVDASETEPVDLGTGWSLSARFVYAPPLDSAPADTVEWDFGDGSEPVIGNVVEHTFPAPGIYIIKQTATNVVGSSTEWYKMEFFGYPTVTYRMQADGMEDVVVKQTKYNIAAATIEDPVRDGFAFGGWFENAECTRSYDFAANTVTEPLVLYAKWTVGETPGAHTVTVMGPEGLVIVLAVGGLFALVSLAVIRRPAVLAVGIAMFAAAALVHFGVITW